MAPKTDERQSAHDSHSSGKSRAATASAGPAVRPSSKRPASGQASTTATPPPKTYERQSAHDSHSSGKSRAATASAGPAVRPSSKRPASGQASTTATPPPKIKSPRADGPRRSSSGPASQQASTPEAQSARKLKPKPARPKPKFDASFNDGSSSTASKTPGALRQSTALGAHLSDLEEALSPEHRTKGQQLRESSIAQQHDSLAKAVKWEEQGGRGYVSQASDAFRSRIGRRKSSVVEAEGAQTDIRAGLSEIRSSVFKGGQSALEQGEENQMYKRRVSQASRTIEAGAFIGGHPEIAAAVGGASALAEASLDVATAERRHMAAKTFDQALHKGDLAPNTSDPLAHATRAAAESQMHKAKTGIGEASVDAVLNVVNAGIAGSGADVAAQIVSSAPGFIRDTQSFLGGTATVMAELSEKVIPEKKKSPDHGIREAIANELQGKVVGWGQDKLMNSTKKPAVTARGEAAVRIADLGRIKGAQESAAQRGLDAAEKDNGILNKTLPSDIAANRRAAVAKQGNRRASVTSEEHQHHRGSDGGGSPRPRSSARN